jgi:hypothetical protein
LCLILFLSISFLTKFKVQSSFDALAQRGLLNQSLQNKTEDKSKQGRQKKKLGVGIAKVLDLFFDCGFGSGSGNDQSVSM